MPPSLPPMPSRVHGQPLDAEPGLGPLTIAGYLRDVTERYREREAVVMHHPSGGRISLSYQELWSRSVRLARALVAAGVDKDTRVGVLMTNRPEHLVSIFGIALAGGIATSLSTFSTPSELEYLLQASAVSILIFEPQVLKTDFGAMLCELEPAIRTAQRGQLRSGRFPYLRQLVTLPDCVTADVPVTTDLAAEGCSVVQRWSDFLAAGQDVPEAVVSARAQAVQPTDSGGLFFSSGTTSLPKGILHTQRAFAIQWWRWPRIFSVEGAVRSWTGNGFFWAANVTMVIGTAFSTGGAVILQPVFEAEAALKLIETERVTLLNGRPHQWARLQAASSWSSADLSSVRYMTRGELIKQHPTVTSDWERPYSFGTTETMTILSGFPSGTAPEVRAGSFGPPLPGNTLKIVVPDSGEVVPRGTRGEICIKGPTLMLGYINKAPEQTFDDEGFYHTGDGGYVDEAGRLFWEGRLNNMIKTGGANVSAEEVDAAIASFPGVKRSQTVGMPHETLSEMVVSCIVPVEGASLQASEIVAHLKGRLASFKVPRRILFFREEELALTGNEKIKVDKVRQLVAERLAVPR